MGKYSADTDSAFDIVKKIVLLIHGGNLDKVIEEINKLFQR